MDPSTADAIADIVASLRPLHDDLALPDYVEIQAVVNTDDGRGGETTEWQAVWSGRGSLDISGLSGNEYLVGNVETVRLPYTVTLPFGTEVSETNRLIVNGNRAFAIGNVRSGEGYEIAVSVDCMEVAMTWLS